MQLKPQEQEDDIIIKEQFAFDRAEYKANSPVIHEDRYKTISEMTSR